MWNVDPRMMCNQHLLGEHVEMHMFMGNIRLHKSLTGYIEKGLVEVHNIRNRHQELVREMLSRGMKHQSPMARITLPRMGLVNVNQNITELKRRCIRCRS